ncbi:hypothetical protein [Ruixingdingia sedimenti]|uniref:Cytochrome C oxidase assembly protein n=1 Tax=Ruixingdingia sedimenti TaxID=3073604 RepID=A0ABU1FCK1_9RHOB|nr:hypothetical protein [Xinfangfangia sp. LG-4]MDR5654122.1 hypothetical protein [Xinfangfangia sp. LG-4]
MSFRPDHELHRRRMGRNLGIGLVLVVFVGLVFGLTIAKISGGGQISGFDHSVRPELVPEETQ